MKKIDGMENEGFERKIKKVKKMWEGDKIFEI